MPSSVDLTDSEGFVWDIDSNINVDNSLGIRDGTDDAFDGGMILRVNGVLIGGNVSVDEGGREANMVPQLVGGIAVTRSIYVSDPALTTTGFARFLESFTNTTDETFTITVETITNSGADGGLQFTATSDGDTNLTVLDTGFVTDDFDTGGDDPAVMIAYGDGTFLPSSTFLLDDEITITHTLTLAPGETQSLLQFATQNTASSQGNSDLTFFASDDPLFEFLGLLEGLTAEERNSVVNYSNVAVETPATLIDSEGNRWGIDDQGTLSTLDSEALSSFSIEEFRQNFGNPVSVTEDAANNAVTVVTTGGPEGLVTVTSTYRALDDQGVIRLVVSVTNGSSLTATIPTLNSVTTTGASPATLVSQLFSPQFGVPTGVVLDDSESGTGGTVPALTVAYGATGPDTTSGFSGGTLTVGMQNQGLVPGQTRGYLFFFAVNDTGLAALADLARLNTPGPAGTGGPFTVRGFVIPELRPDRSRPPADHPRR